MQNNPEPLSVLVEKDLFEWLVEYAVCLRGDWAWKRNSTRSNNAEMARLDEHIFKALQLRESIWHDIRDDHDDEYVAELAKKQLEQIKPIP